MLLSSMDVSTSVKDIKTPAEAVGSGCVYPALGTAREP